MSKLRSSVKLLPSIKLKAEIFAVKMIFFSTVKDFCSKSVILLFKKQPVVSNSRTPAVTMRSNDRNGSDEKNFTYNISVTY